MERKRERAPEIAAPAYYDVYAKDECDPRGPITGKPPDPELEAQVQEIARPAPAPTARPHIQRQVESLMDTWAVCNAGVAFDSRAALVRSLEDDVKTRVERQEEEGDGSVWLQYDERCVAQLLVVRISRGAPWVYLGHEFISYDALP